MNQITKSKKKKIKYGGIKMYIMIMEDGEIGTVTSISKDDLFSVDQGMVDIIDISDPKRPLRYFNSVWDELPSFE